MCFVNKKLALVRYNEMRIAEMNREKETAEYRSRTTRLAKWSELVTRANQDLQVSTGVPERIMLLGHAWASFFAWHVHIDWMHCIL